MNKVWHAGDYPLQWSVGRPLIMGIVNVTPDSFSDGGKYVALELALQHARQLLDEGADILDVGGESTRPGAQGVDADEEWRRVGEVIGELVTWQVPVSLDSMKPSLMRKAVDSGVAILNDVQGFRSAEAQQALIGSNCGAVIMHMQGEPRSMQHSPAYQQVVPEVTQFLGQQLQALEAAGVSSSRLLVDPGFGFGKNLDHNLELMRAIPELGKLGAGVLIGVSRKRMIGELTGRSEPMQRVSGSVAAALYAAAQGAAVLRVHDVAATVDALKVQTALLSIPATA